MMKAFSFLTILESLSKKLSILRTKMHSDDLRVDYESITSQLRVNPLFSRTSLSASFADLSRRASHFAAIFTILFTIGVGNVWGAYDVPANGKVTLSTKVNNSGRFNVEASGVYHFRLSDGYSWGNENGIKTQSNQCGVIFYLDASTEIEVGIKHTESKNAHDVTVHVYSIPESEYKQFDDNKAGAAESDRTFSTGPSTSSDDSFTISVAAESKTFTGTKTLGAGYYAVVPVGSKSNTYFNSIKFTSGGGGETPNPGNPMDNLVLISSDYTFTPTAALTANTLYEENRFISLGDGNGFNNGIQLKTNRQLAFKVAAGAQIKVTFRAKDDRKLQIGTTSAGTDLANSATSPVTATQTTGGIVYLSASSDLYASEIEITFPQSTTYTLTNAVNTNGYGTVAPTSVSGIPSGTVTSSSSNTYTVNGTTVTAIPATNTAQYTYAFDSWSGLPATVTGNATVTANFTRTLNKYTITWKNADGATLETDNNVAYGATPTYNGTEPTKAADAQYTYTFNAWSPEIATVTGNATYTATFTATPIETPEPEQVPQVGTFTGMGMSGSVNLYWTMPTRPVTTRVDIASATLSGAVEESNAATITKENTNEIKVEYSTNTTWRTTGVQIPLATPQTNVESITFEYKSASNQSVDLIPFLYDGNTRWVESGFTKLTPTEWTSHTSVITKGLWDKEDELYSKDKTIQSVNFYANPATATSGTFYIRNVVLNQGTQVAASGLIIVRKVGSNPTSPTDGTQVYNGNGIAATCTDNGLINGTTYHYAAYAHDGQGNYSEPLYWQYTYIEGLNTYAPDDTDFPNPERGFYEQVQWNANDGYNAVIGDSYFDDARAASRSLILRIYYMDSETLRTNQQLPNDFITMFNADMAKFRTNGMKCILRFAYDENSGDGAQDASPATWATHLAQLKPHLLVNADVIYVVQAGFLGVWGEWYYSSQGTGDDIELAVKNNLIGQLLEAVPANRCVQLRTPLFKKQYLDHNNALTPETAYKGTAQARLGHHNDAFLNGEENQGTYENRTTDMEYIAQECLYVPIGGETNLEESEVAELYEEYCKGTVAEAEMAQLHYSYLNYSYSTVVTNRWKEEGSYARMSKYMGYRFELTNATLPNEATAGTQMNVQLNIKNVGYAPLYNERHAYIVFKNNTNTYSIQLSSDPSSDPRTWAPNSATTAINENVTLPVDMLAGTYDLYLYLPDASASIANNPKYAVRFANQGIWESETGYNKLNKQVEVTATELDTYTITYNLNGGTGTEPTEQTAVEGQSVTLATATGFSKAGHTFAGWSDGTNTYEAGTTYTMPASDVALTAQWKIISYTITFKNGETVLQTSTIEYGARPEYTGLTPTKAEDAQYTYTFSGWNPAITTVTGDATYTATFAQTAKTYTLTWDVNGGSALTGDYTTGMVAYGTTITKPEAPTREGYTFAGWSPAVAATMPAANTTYTAQWEEIEVESITVNPTTLDLKKGESATLTATVSPNNALNKTVTWANPSITTLSSTTGATITVTGKSNGKEKELKAEADGKQATVEVSVYYEVQYNSNGGSACTVGKYYEGNGVTLPTPTRDGYTFAGWYDNEALTQLAGAAGATYKPTDNITLYAKWTAAKTNPTTTWDVAEEPVYAGQLVPVSVNTTSDATLTTSSLTTNKGTLQDVTVNGQTITATLLVPDNASGTITLTLTTDATENYNTSTSTKTITIDDCPSAGGGGEETITLAATDNQESGYFFVGDGSIITNIVGQGAKSVSISGKNDDKKSKITVDGSNKEATITFTIGTGITITSFKTIGTTNNNTTYDLDGTSVTIGTALTGLNKTSSMVFKLSCTDASGSSNRNTEISSFVLTYTSSGSGESALETNLAWSGDLSSGVSQQVGDANFTYTASSNNSAGAITYSSSVTSVATINQTTGEVTIVGAGTTIITATIDAIGCYPEKSITYTLAVTSTDEPEPTTYTVTVNSATNGTVTASQTTNVAQGETVTLTVTPASGYELGTLTVKDASNNDVTVTNNTFIMPASNVTLTAQWTAVTYNIKYFEAIGDDATAQDLRELTIEGAKTTYTIEDAVDLPTPLPAKDGHTATGWYNQYCVFEDGGTGKGWAGCETTTGHPAGYYGHANYIVKYTSDVPAGTLYTVTVNSTTNGTVTADPITNVAQGETVTLTVTPEIGYELGTLTVKDASDSDVTVTNNTFIMPASNVTVSATFTAIETPEPGECANLIKYDLSQQNPTEKDKETEVATTDENGSGIYKLNGIEGNAVVDNGFKLVNAGDYIGVELSSGNFQVGDKVTIYLTKESGTQGHTYLKIFDRKNPSSAEHVLGTIETPVVGENIFTLESETEYIYVARTSIFNQNPFIKYISVCRPTTPDPEPGSYTLTYNENQPAVWENVFAFKNIPVEQTLTNGTGNVSANEPVITDDCDYAIYTFAGWNTQADGTGKSYTAGADITITENTTLYAQWTPRTFDVKYFDTDRTTPLEGMVNTTYTFGVGIPNLPTPTKSGSEFAGWIAFWDGGERTVTEIEPTAWGVLQLAAQWEVNCTMPTTTFANGRYVIGSEALDLSTLIAIANNNSEGAITYAVTGGVAATIDGSSFTCDRIGVVTVTATQAASGDYCEKIMTATINVAMPVTSGCAQMFTFDTKNNISNPDGQKGSSYLDLSSYATINGLSTTGKVGIKDMANNNKTSTTLIKNEEIYFPNTNTYLKVENLSTPLAAGDEISIGTGQSATTEYIITISGTQCTSNCITTAGQLYTIPTGSSLIGVTTFYIWSANAERYLNTINICRPAYTITYKANNGKEEDVVSENAVLVAGCPNTFTVPAGKQFAGWNTVADGTGTSYSVGTIIPENDLTLYAQWECIEPVFTVSCDKTAYAKDEADAKPITVSVTAGNSGGVTYQWFASDKNDRTTGTAITDKTAAASYTPSTATEGTTYYWCEITNSCTTVKTPTIAITVTVTKNNADVEWTNPTAVNYGGGGYEISATVNNEWDGTLLPSMLTAPTGVIIKGVTITGKKIEATFDVTTTFDRTIENHQSSIPFVLTLPETTTYNPLVSENKVSYDACANGGGTEYRIPVLNGDAEKDGNYYYWSNENGWVSPSPNNSCSGKGESTTFADGEEFDYVHGSNSQTTFVRTFKAGIDKVRIYANFRASGMTVTDVYKYSDYFSINNNYKLDISSYTIIYNDDVNATNLGESEYGFVDVILNSPLAQNEIIALKFNTNRVRVQGAAIIEQSAGTIETTLSFATAGSITKTQNDANFTNKATPSNNTLGTITYSSSDENVATVNPTTGEVSIIAAGTTIITATLAPSGCYQGATATYELTVTEQTCNIAAGTLSASKTDKYDCEEVTLTLSNYEQGATIEWWHNGEAINSKPGIAISNNTLTTTLEGTYSVLVTKGCSIRSNSVTITNIAFASATPLVNEWYIKNGRLTPPIALWKLEGGARIAGVGWMRGEEASTAPYDNPENVIYVENGIVYLTGTPPQANGTGEDIRYTILLSIYNSCDDSPMVVAETITIVHQKNTDKHVLAFVVTGAEKGGFTEEIPAEQTTNVPLYNEISQEFDVLATNIYATDNEQLLKEYYSRFDIICITDYPDTKKTGVNGKSYTDAMGALIDIRPILSMEAWVSNLPNWNDKGVKGDPVSPTTRQYSMLLQCKDHEIFAGTTLITEGSGDEEMYRVTMVDATKEDYVTLDKVEENPHQEKEGYKYGSNPALQGFRYESSLSTMLPIGTIEDGAGKIIQVGLERQQEEEARMMVVGVNSYAMERLTDDGKTVVINTLKYLMKKSAEDISDCSIFFDNRAGDNQWNNPANWGPSYNSVPLSYQGARILEPCIVSDVVAKAAKVKIATSGTYNRGAKTANGSLTIAPNGALVVGGVISEVTAPNYYEIRPTQAENLIVQAEDESDSQHRLGALIHNNENGETSAIVEMWNPSYWEIDQQTGKKKKYWSYVAVPIQEAPIPEFFYHGFTYLYDETQGWIKKGDGTTLYPFQGIGASLQTGNKETFRGKLATTDDQDIILTKTDIAGAGQNLIGNSWTAPIQIANFEEEDFNGATATVYVYNTGKDDKYKDPTYVEGSVENDGAATAGQWIGVPIGVAGLPEYTGLKVIPAMNAFQVNTNQETELHLNYNRLVRGEGKGGVNSESNLNQPMRAPHKPIEALMRIRVAGEKTHTDIWLLQDERFDYGFDNGWEAEFVEGDDRSAQLYAVSEIGKMAFLAQPELDGTLLGFAPSRDGAEYTFSFYYTGSQKLYLNDLKLQTSTLVSDNDTYLFTYEKGDEQRFIISTAPFNIPDISTGVGNTTNGENAKAVKFIKDDKIFIFVNGTLYDATGKMVVKH